MGAVLRNKHIAAGGAIIALMIAMAAFAPLLTPYGFGELDFAVKNQPPSAQHIMGTDPYGRDVWCRIAYGARVSLTVSLVAVAIAISCGSLLGVASGYMRGRLDFALGRIIDVMMAFPAILLSLIIGVVLGASVRNMCFSIGIPLIPIFYRVARGATLNVGGRTYVTASRSIGSGRLRTMAWHVLPNVLPQIFVVLSVGMGGSILAEASLGFLGLGIPQPTPSWGLIVNEGKAHIFAAPWTTAFSGGFIALTVLGFNLLGDGLRDFLDPKLKGAGG
ncbi:MAG: ABC transporter permease [Clostridiales bacterium]|jgi:peptide/nickel transport system permease protein|nr:ABC transporter permease [Clostridiales bacterium]